MSEDKLTVGDGRFDITLSEAESTSRKELWQTIQSLKRTDCCRTAVEETLTRVREKINDMPSGEISIIDALDIINAELKLLEEK